MPRQPNTPANPFFSAPKPPAEDPGTVLTPEELNNHGESGDKIGETDCSGESDDKIGENKTKWCKDLSKISTLPVEKFVGKPAFEVTSL